VQVAAEALMNGKRMLEAEVDSFRKQQVTDARAYHSTIEDLSRTLTRTQKDRDALESQLNSYNL
jgi:predicted RNase H-like nuclease (RuvC/YqgF family)